MVTTIISMKNIHQIDVNHYQAHEYKYESGNVQTVVIKSNSQLPLGSTRSYTWEVFGYDRDRTQTPRIDRHSKYAYFPITVKTGDTGDVTILKGGHNGQQQHSLIYTDHNVVGDPEIPLENPGSTIAIEMHSKDMHIGVRLTVENDVGQKDTLIIPAFLNTSN